MKNIDENEIMEIDDGMEAEETSCGSSGAVVAGFVGGLLATLFVKGASKAVAKVKASIAKRKQRKELAAEVEADSDDIIDDDETQND